LRFPLQGAVLLETSYISLDDRFAAQIVFVAWLGFRRARSARPTFACDCGGALPAYGPVTELSRFLSFAVLRIEIGFLSYKRIEDWHTHANHVINIPRDELHAMD
jgi:hypothetical protein